MSKRDKVVGKIQKLLAIAADDGASPEEIDNAVNFAQKLMDSYHLTEEDLTHEPADDYAEIDNAEFREVRSFVGKKLYYWESVLASVISKFSGVKCYINDEHRIVRNHRGVAQMDDKDNPKYGKSIVWYGVAEDCHIARELYDEIRTLIASMAVLKFASVYKGDGASYAQGFVSGLWHQVSNAQKALTNVSGSTALVLVARRDDLIKYKQDKAKDWLAKSTDVKLSNRQRSQGTTTGSHTAYREGKEDGLSADISASRNAKITE